MSWHFSRALVEASSAASCSGGGASAPSSSSPTHGTCWSPGRTTEASSPSRSGMMYEPSTGTRGADVLTWCLEASRVRTSAAPERAPDWPGLVQDSGGRWHESLARYNPATSTWRTRQCSLLGGSESFSVTWPRWGLMLGGEFWALTMPALPTSGIGSGSSRLHGNGWPTPNACDGAQGAVMTEERLMALIETGRPAKRKDGGEYHAKLAEMVEARRMYATPTATANQLCPSMQKHPGCRAMWKTPVAVAAVNRAKGKFNSRGEPGLSGQVGGSLNPTWVEWLMGWPLNWTAHSTPCYSAFTDWRSQHGTEQRTEAGAEDVRREGVRNVWWNHDPSTPPQERERDGQQRPEHLDPVPVVPHEGSHDDRGLGRGPDQGCIVRGVRDGFYAETEQAREALREPGMPEGERKEIGRTAVGVPCRVDRLRAIGNGQVPQCAALAWETLTEPTDSPKEGRDEF